MIRQRLDGGIATKLSAASCAAGCPVGLVRGEADGEMLLHPDEGVRGVIAPIFERSGEFGATRQVWLWLRRESVRFLRFSASRTRRSAG